MQKIKTKNNIDATKYVNIETGELLSAEKPGATSINIDTNLVMIDYKEYVIIDSKALRYIKNNFNNSDFARIVEMADMVKGNSNYVYDRRNNVPHTDKTLMKELDLTRNRFVDFVNRLVDKEVIYLMIGSKNKKKFKYIILNPYLARKTKTTDENILCYFTDLRNL